MKLYTLIAIVNGQPCVVLKHNSNDLARVFTSEVQANMAVIEMSYIFNKKYYYQDIEEILAHCDKPTEKNIKRYLKKFERFCNKKTKEYMEANQ